MHSAVIFVMEAETGCEIKRARDAVEMVETIQSMIDVSADRLEGLRTQCSTSAELTQQEIRTLEVGGSQRWAQRTLSLSVIRDPGLKDIDTQGL